MMAKARAREGHSERRPRSTCAQCLSIYNQKPSSKGLLARKFDWRGAQTSSVAHLTFGTRARLGSSPNVRCKSYTRNIVLLVFLAVPTFARALVATGGKCRNRNISAERRCEGSGALARRGDDGRPIAGLGRYAHGPFAVVGLESLRTDQDDGSGARLLHRRGDCAAP